MLKLFRLRKMRNSNFNSFIEPHHHFTLVYRDEQKTDEILIAQTLQIWHA